MTPEEIARYKPLLLNLLPKDGTSRGNITLIPEFTNKVRDKFGAEISDAAYWDVRNALITEGIVGKGRGKGGSVYLVNALAEKEQEKKVRKKQKESDLYAPIFEVIKQTWVKENGIQDFIIQQTAAQGKKHTGGKWTRPDISLVAVKLYPFIPGKILEVVTFEIKGANEYGIEGVFETAAHSVFAHKSYLAVYLPDGPPESEEFDRMQRECERFGIGLLIFADVSDWSTYEELVSPDRKHPDPFDINLFISSQINKENQTRIQQLLR